MIQHRTSDKSDNAVGKKAVLVLLLFFGLGGLIVTFIPSASNQLSGLLTRFTFDKRIPVRVLFIGNSYTSMNALPEMVQELANDFHVEKRMIVDQVLVGGAKLKDHWDRGTALQRIQSEKWDFIVLQEQSQVPLPAFGRDSFFVPYVKKFDEAIRGTGAKPVLYMTWQRPDTNAEAGEWTKSFLNLADDTHMLVAPVGIAYECAKKNLPDWNPFMDPNGHPTLEASYLATFVFYETLFNDGSVGRIPQKTGIIVPMFLTMPDERGARLRACAREAVAQVADLNKKSQ